MARVPPVDWHEVLVLLMLGLPAHHRDDEAPEARRARLATIATSVIDAAARATCRDHPEDDACVRHWPGSEQDLTVLLVTQAYQESRFALNVHEGRCRSYECDPYRDPRTGKIVHRARSLWQLQLSSLTADEWDEVEGTSLEATRAAAFAASKLLGRGLRSCRTVIGAISRYCGVASCTWSGAGPRHRQYLYLRAKGLRLAAAIPTE